MYLVYGLWSDHNWYRDIVSGHCSNTWLLEKQNWQEGYWTFSFLIVLLTLLVHCRILMVLNESQQLLEFLILHLCLKCFWKRMVNNIQELIKN